MELENSLSELLGVRVELVTKKALKPYIGQQILQEVPMSEKDCCRITSMTYWNQ